MHHREAGRDVRIAEIEIEMLKLTGQDEALVYDPVRGETDDVEVLVAGAVLDLPPDDVETQLKGGLVRAVSRAVDEELPDDRHDSAGQHADGVGVCGYVAPSEKSAALVPHGPLDDAHAPFPRVGVLRQEDRADAVVSQIGEVEAERRGLFGEELVGHLNQEASAVAGLRVRARRASMSEVYEGFEALLDDVVGLPTLDVGDETDSAGVVLEARVVEALLYWTREIGIWVRSVHDGKIILIRAIATLFSLT